jgi:hypothetical protein
VVRENRGLHVSKLLALKDSICLQWDITSLLIVQLLADGTFLLVDGLHRLTAVLQLIMANILPAYYTVRCVVLSADTPANSHQEDYSDREYGAYISNMVSRWAGSDYESSEDEYAHWRYHRGRLYHMYFYTCIELRTGHYIIYYIVSHLPIDLVRLLLY